jgi:hypothetical protein
MRTRAIFDEIVSGEYAENLRKTRGEARIDSGASVAPLFATGEYADNEGMDKLLKELENLAVPMEYAEFSRETYNRLFPFGRVKSPIETVKLGANQFEKLKDRGREKYLAAMRQTLTDPVAVFEETRDEGKAHLYIKSFKDTNNKYDFVMSVVVGIGKENVAISTGPRKRPQIRKIMAGNPLIYRGGGSPTDGTGGGKPSPLPVTSLSPDSAEKSSGISDPDDTAEAPLFQLVEADAEQTQKYRDFVKEAWDKAVNHKEGDAIPNEEFLLSVDKDGYRHITTTQRIRHIYKQHGNEKLEQFRRQIAIKESEIEIIPDIINNYSFAIRNFTFEGNKSILYAKEGAKNTYIYVEHISDKYKRNTTATFYNENGRTSSEAVLRILKNKNNCDVSNAEIITGRGGGNPTNTAGPKPGGTAAKSVSLPDISLSPESANKSSDLSGGGDTLFQLVEADADEAVERYDSPEAWMEADRKAMEADEGGEFPDAEGWDAEAEREKYEALYNEAVERRAARLDAEGKLPMTTSRADNLFIEKMENRDTLLNFAGLINETMYESPPIFPLFRKKGVSQPKPAPCLDPLTARAGKIAALPRQPAGKAKAGGLQRNKSYTRKAILAPDSRCPCATRRKSPSQALSKPIDRGLDPRLRRLCRKRF